MVLKCFGRPEDEDAEDARRASKEIDRRMAEWSKIYQQAIKILLLGAGEAGKTTIIKQMKILHIAGFSDKERADFAVEVRRNLKESICALCANLSLLKPSIALENSELNPLITMVQTAEASFTQEFYDATRELWKDGGIRECYRRSNEFQINECAEYFLNRVDEIRQGNYLPSDEDILHCRKKTSGIQKIEFSVKVPKRHGGGLQSFWMFDVGGQRGERRKWIQAFDGIHAVLFLVGCSSFDQVLREDSATNRLREAVTLFEDVWDSRYLRAAGMILFLNKQDVLKTKIEAGHRLQDYFPDFAEYKMPAGKSASDEVERARAFIRDLFLEVARTASVTPLDRRLSIGPSIVMTPEGGPTTPRECYWHYTVAVDTRNVRTVFEDVHSMVITWNLADLGLQ